MEVSALPRPGGGIQPRSQRLLTTFGDDRLVDQLRRGNDAAFEAVYDRHHRGLLSFCRHMLRSREEAEDAVQQTFLNAYRDLQGSDKEINLKPWLYTIARNRCLSILRARHEQPAEIDDIPIAGFSEEVAQRDDLRALLSDMRELPEDQRAALVLSELGDLSHTEIAGIVGCETMKVKSLVFQARSSLIESRDARDVPCEEIREQLATLTGGALRRGPLRRHLKACPGCAEFREQVKRQRQMVACLLPVVPSVGLKQGVLAAVGIGGSGGGAAIAAGAGGGGLVSGLLSSTAAKLGLVAIIATGAVGGGVAVEKATDADGTTPNPSVSLRDLFGTSGGVSDQTKGAHQRDLVAGVRAALPGHANMGSAGGHGHGKHSNHARDNSLAAGASTTSGAAAGAKSHGHANGHTKTHANRGRHLALGHRPRGQHPAHPPKPAHPVKSTPPPPPPEPTTTQDDKDKTKSHGSKVGGTGVLDATGKKRLVPKL